MTTVSIAPAAQRRAVEAVLRSRHRACAHLDYAVNLTMKHGWQIEPSPDGSFWAVCATRTIKTPPLEDDGDFAEFLHEGGHLEDPHGKTRRRTSKQEPAHTVVSIEGEAAAWIWALQKGGHRWNTTMQARLAECLESYVLFNENYADLRVLESVIEHGAEQAKHLVRLRPRVLPDVIVRLQEEVRA